MRLDAVLTVGAGIIRQELGNKKFKEEFTMSQKVTIVSEGQPQKGQKARSSNNFSTADFSEKARLTLTCIVSNVYSAFRSKLFITANNPGKSMSGAE